MKPQPESPSGPTSPTSPTDPIKDPETIAQEERVKEIVDSVIKQLENTYQIDSPVIEKVLGQINEVDNTVKVTLIVDSPTGDKVSVVAIAPIDGQVDPIIESVKPVTQEIVEKIQ